MFSLFFTLNGGNMKNTIKECAKCQLRYVYYWFKEDEDICGFCKSSEVKDAKRDKVIRIVS